MRIWGIALAALAACSSTTNIYEQAGDGGEGAPDATFSLAQGSPDASAEEAGDAVDADGASSEADAGTLTADADADDETGLDAGETTGWLIDSSVCPATYPLPANGSNNCTSGYSNSGSSCPTACGLPNYYDCATGGHPDAGRCVMVGGSSSGAFCCSDETCSRASAADDECLADAGFSGRPAAYSCPADLLPDASGNCAALRAGGGTSFYCCSQ